MNLAELKKIAEKSNDFGKMTIPSYVFTELISNYEKAVEALKFYGDSDNYGHVSAESLKYIVLNENDMGKGEFQLSERVDDDRVGGKLARQTLKELGEVE